MNFQHRCLPCQLKICKCSCYNILIGNTNGIYQYRDIMKLTAQFAARNGRQFINQLAQRESRNYQFDFLRPSHSLFPFFTELVKQYTKVLAPPKDLKEKLLMNKNTKYKILDRVKERVEWVAWTEAERKKKEDEDEKERRK